MPTPPEIRFRMSREALENMIRKNKFKVRVSFIAGCFAGAFVLLVTVLIMSLPIK